MIRNVSWAPNHIRIISEGIWPFQITLKYKKNYIEIEKYLFSKIVVLFHNSIVLLTD